MSVDLHERRAELAALDERIAAACTGEGSVVLLEGAAGIGKTRLLDAAGTRAQARGMQVLSGSGSELASDVPFGVVRELLEPALAELSDETREGMLAGAASPARVLFSGQEPGAPLARGEIVSSVLHGLYWICASLAGEGPIALFVDDAHWSDAVSLRWLRFMAPRLEGMDALLIVAFRPPETRSPGDLLEGLRRERGALLLRPAALSGSAVASVVRSKLSPDADGELCAACHRASGGNPFLLTELLASLDPDERPDPHGVLSVSVESVSRSVLPRVARLGDAAAALTRALAVLGGEGELALAAQLAGIDYEAAGAAADELARSQILDRDAKLAFVHPLVRSSIYDDLPHAERARSHARAARLLAGGGAGVDAVARHLLSAHQAGDPWAVRWLRLGAARATASGAPENAVTYLRRALAEPPAAEERPSLLLELGRAEAASFAPEAEERLSAALEAAESRERRARIALELGQALMLRERAEPAIEVFHRGIEALGDEDRELALQLEAEAIVASSLTLGAGRVAAERVARLARLTGATPGERRVLAGIAWEYGLTGDVPADEVSRLAKLALAGGELLALQGPESPPFFAAMNALSVSGRTTESVAHLTDALSEAQRARSIGAFAAASIWRSWALYRRGSLLEAEEDARRAISLAVEHEYALSTALALTVLVECLVERGLSEQASEELDRLWDESRLRRSTLYPPLLAARGRLRAISGSPAEGLEDFRACGRLQLASGYGNPGTGAWRSGAARLLRRLGDAREAERLVAEEVELARAFGEPRALGVALRAAGLIASGHGGLGLLEEAVTVLAGSDGRLEHARALRSLGAAMHASGRSADARELLRAALDIAHRCGARVVAEDARRTLLAAGGRPRRLALSGVEALTPSELRIARLAADGLTNREIAEQQFLTLRMVELHLTRCYRKLGISSRTKLPPALADSRLSEEE